MRKHEVRSPGDALAYITDCTLATVASMAMLKSRKQGELERQIGIAQTAVDWMREMSVDAAGTRAEQIIRHGLTVAEWASNYDARKPL